MDEEEGLLWQDVLDEIMAGRPDNLVCPHCNHQPLQVGDTPTGKTRIACAECGKFIEGLFSLG